MGRRYHSRLRHCISVVRLAMKLLEGGRQLVFVCPNHPFEQIDFIMEELKALDTFGNGQRQVFSLDIIIIIKCIK